MTNSVLSSGSAAALYRLCAASDVNEDEGLVVEVAGCALAVWNVGGQIYVTDDTCSHGQASLARDGMVDGFEIVCGLHQGSFDVRSGQVVSAPCLVPIRSYPVHLMEGGVYIDPDIGAA